MDKISLQRFLASPERFISEAASGDRYISVTTDDGKTAVIIDDAEWNILVEALSLCVKHPEWTPEK